MQTAKGWAKRRAARCREWRTERPPPLPCRAGMSASLLDIEQSNEVLAAAPRHSNASTRLSQTRARLMPASHGRA